MLHFGGGSSGRTTKSYQAGPGRRKVFYAVALVGLTALAIKAALDPQTWNWPAPAAHQGPEDTVLRQAGAEERMEGEFHAPAPADSGQQPTRQLFPGVRQEYLVEVRDDTFFRSPENNAFFHLFQILENADEDQLRQASAGTVTFAQLHNQPAAYRGEVVTLRGRLRQLQRVSAARNEYNVDDYYQATLQPDDNPTFPVLVDVRHLPPGFPSQLELPPANQTVAAQACNEEVVVTGFFFKRLAYRARDDVRTAPLVLARTFQWSAPPAVTSAQQTPTRTFSWLAAGVTVGLLLLTLAVAFSRGASSGQRYSSRAAPSAGALAAINDMQNGPSPAEYLRTLEQQAATPPQLGLPQPAAAPENP